MQQRLLMACTVGYVVASSVYKTCKEVSRQQSPVKQLSHLSNSSDSNKKATRLSIQSTKVVGRAAVYGGLLCARQVTCTRSAHGLRVHVVQW